MKIEMPAAVLSYLKLYFALLYPQVKLVVLFHVYSKAFAPLNSKGLMNPMFLSFINLHFLPAIGEKFAWPAFRKKLQSGKTH